MRYMDDFLTSVSSAEPEVQTFTLTSEDEFLVLACDGLWDVMSSQRCMELARTHLRDNNDPQLCAEHLVRTTADAMASCLRIATPHALLLAENLLANAQSTIYCRTALGKCSIRLSVITDDFCCGSCQAARRTVQVQSSLDMKSVDNVTAMVVCFSKDPPPARLAGRSASRGPSRSLSRECLSTLSSALLDAQCQPAGLGARAAEARESSD